MIATYLVERKFGLDHPFIFDLAIVSFGEGKIGDFYSVSLQENLII